MKYSIRLITSIAFILIFAISATISTNAYSEESDASHSSGTAVLDKTDKPAKSKGKDSKKKSKSKDKKSTKSTKSSSKASKSSGKASKSTKSSSKSSSKSKKKPSKDKISKSVEAISDATEPIFSKEEIERYEEMSYETWESPSGTSEHGLPIEPGFVQPYPYGNLMRQYCSTGSRHRGHDLGFVGEKDSGMGTVINSATRAVVTFIGRTEENSGEFGKYDKRDGNATRTGKEFPRQILVPGYGLVYPFSLNYGRWQSGNVIVTKVLDGPLKDYSIRYMHMAAIRPDLKVGSVVEAGEHIAVMGGTAVMDSYPHVHIDMETPSGARANLSPYLGIPQTKSRCRSAALAKDSQAAQAAQAHKSASKDNAKKASKSKNSSSADKKAKPSTNKKASPKKRARSAYIKNADNETMPQQRTLARKKDE